MRGIFHHTMFYNHPLYSHQTATGAVRPCRSVPRSALLGSNHCRPRANWRKTVESCAAASPCLYFRRALAVAEYWLSQSIGFRRAWPSQSISLAKRGRCHDCMLLFGVKGLPDTKDMAIRVSNVHFTYVPGHIFRRPGHFYVLLQAGFIHGINICNPE